MSHVTVSPTLTVTCSGTHVHFCGSLSVSATFTTWFAGATYGTLGTARTARTTPAWAGTAAAAGTNSTAPRAASMRLERFIGETPLLFVGGSTQRNRRSWLRAVPLPYPTRSCYPELHQTTPVPTDARPRSFRRPTCKCMTLGRCYW